MTHQTMKLIALLLVSIQTILISCNGEQTSHTPDKISTKRIGDTVTEIGNNIMVVYQDKKNNYWFGSWESGLYMYDGKTILHLTTKSGLPHNRIEEIKEDKSGNILINTTKGISKFDGKNFTTLSFANSNNDWKLEPTDLWFKQGWELGLVARYDGDSLHLLTLPNTKMGDEYLSTHRNDAASPYAVYSIYEDTQGNIWFGTAVLGVCRFDGKTFNWISENDVTEIHDGPANGVRSIIEDKDGYFWFNTMYRYNIYGNKVQSTFYTREKNIGGLDGKNDGRLSEYLSIVKDNNNQLWIATYLDGVWRYNGSNVIHYPVKQGTKNITAFSIYKDNNGHLWLGTHENGVFQFNGQAFEKFIPL
jgi:ligand-binding sensor domain-containing protein